MLDTTGRSRTAIILVVILTIALLANVTVLNTTNAQTTMTVHCNDCNEDHDFYVNDITISTNNIQVPGSGGLADQVLIFSNDFNNHFEVQYQGIPSGTEWTDLINKLRAASMGDKVVWDSSFALSFKCKNTGYITPAMPIKVSILLVTDLNIQFDAASGNFSDGSKTKSVDVTCSEPSGLALDNKIPEDPSLTGSKFVGWVSEDNSAVNSKTIFKKSAKVVAQYESKEIPKTTTKKKSKPKLGGSSTADPKSASDASAVKTASAAVDTVVDVTAGSDSSNTKADTKKAKADTDTIKIGDKYTPKAAVGDNDKVGIPSYVMPVTIAIFVLALALLYFLMSRGRKKDKYYS